MKRRAAGFTLVEILVSLAILVLATALIFGSYHQVARVKKKGELMLDRMRQSDWVMDQLVVALRSAVLLENNPQKCGFWLEDDEDQYPADVISWITSSAAFMPPQSQMAFGLHRVFLSIEDDEDGNPALHASGYPYLTDSEADDFEEPEPWLISRRIKGLSCRVYDDFNKEWADEWEKDTTVPSFVEITLFVQADDDEAKVREITRAVQLPAGSFAKNRRRTGGDDATPADPADPGAVGQAGNLRVNDDPRIIQGGGGGSGMTPGRGNREGNREGNRDGNNRGDRRGGSGRDNGRGGGPGLAPGGGGGPPGVGGGRRGGGQ
jgi:prepilin-type N-terminal cleavage/methylation domain-containing protein